MKGQERSGVAELPHHGTRELSIFADCAIDLHDRYVPLSIAQYGQGRRAPP